MDPQASRWCLTILERTLTISPPFFVEAWTRKICNGYLNPPCFEVQQVKRHSTVFDVETTGLHVQQATGPSPRFVDIRCDLHHINLGSRIMEKEKRSMRYNEAF
jgi:hypothetical protein